MADPRRVSLALGSGGARGYAHIGVIQVLEERGFEIVGIAGTSMGAVVGGLHAAGQLGAYTEWVSSLTQRDVLRLLDPSLRAPGVIHGEKIMARVRELLSGALIEDLRIPFTAVATDLLDRKEVWFQKGPLDVAIRASIALPSFITPVMLNGRLLADGGMMNPVPIAPLAAFPSDVTVAVSLAGDDEAESGSGPAVESSEAQPADEWRDRFTHSAAQVLENETLRRVAGWFGAGRDDKQPHLGAEPAPSAFGDLPPGLGVLDMMQLSLESLQTVVTRYRLAGYPPDLVVSIPRRACRVLDFHRGADMIALGREVAEAALARWSPGQDP